MKRTVFDPQSRDYIEVKVISSVIILCKLRIATFVGTWNDKENIY